MIKGVYDVWVINDNIFIIILIMQVICVYIIIQDQLVFMVIILRMLIDFSEVEKNES